VVKNCLRFGMWIIAPVYAPVLIASQPPALAAILRPAIPTVASLQGQRPHPDRREQSLPDAGLQFSGVGEPSAGNALICSWIEQRKRELLVTMPVFPDRELQA